MTDLDVVERAASLFGTDVVQARNEKRNPKWKPCFSAQLRGAKAIALMVRLRPFMGIRRRCRIEEVIARYVPGLKGGGAKQKRSAQRRRSD
jgi:hypothetical protein